MKLPITDHRDKKEIYNQIVSMAKEYVPEWNPTDNEDDVGVILAKIFSEMFEETIQRFNKMPYKNYIYFLNLLGATIKYTPNKLNNCLSVIARFNNILNISYPEYVTYNCYYPAKQFNFNLSASYKY